MGSGGNRGVASCVRMSKACAVYVSNCFHPLVGREEPTEVIAVDYSQVHRPASCATG